MMTRFNKKDCYTTVTVEGFSVSAFWGMLSLWGFRRKRQGQKEAERRREESRKKWRSDQWKADGKRER